VSGTSSLDCIAKAAAENPMALFYLRVMSALMTRSRYSIRAGLRQYPEKYVDPGSIIGASF
jgi:hypothetical protein